MSSKETGGKSPKLSIVKGGAASEAKAHLGIPLEGQVSLKKLETRLLDLGTVEIVEGMLCGPLRSRFKPLTEPRKRPGARVPGRLVLEMILDATDNAAPDTDDEFDIETDYHHNILASHIRRLESFLERDWVLKLIKAGEHKLVREIWFDSVLNQPSFFSPKKGKPKIRKDVPADQWLVDRE